MSSREGLYFSKRLRREETQLVCKDRILSLDQHEHLFGRELANLLRHQQVSFPYLFNLGAPMKSHQFDRSRLGLVAHGAPTEALRDGFGSCLVVRAAHDLVST